MHWIALQWLPDAAAGTPGASVRPEQTALPSAEAMGWWALEFTPRVAWVDEALLLEVSACERLWGGRRALMRQMASSLPPGLRLQQAQGATSLIALARLRMYACGEQPPAGVPDDLPLETLTAARPHLDVLAHLGCRRWGDVAALPRAGLTRRFGAPLREALDRAWGLCPESHEWLLLPEAFDQKLELPALAQGAPELMWSANRLLASLQIWLRGRQRGVLSLELQWTLDLRRFNGVDLPPHQSITVRTAQPTQDMAHLRRLMSERLALTQLAAPASWLRLRSVDTTPWAGASTSFLPEDNRKGDRLHELVERLSTRLGADQVLRASARADARPQAMQQWQPALTSMAAAAAPVDPRGNGLHPPWLLREPLPLPMHDGHPCYRGPLRRLVGPQRLEAGWWGDSRSGGQPSVRDYYIAQSPEAGLVWVFCERLAAATDDTAPRWFLQGLYA
ncbi:Y-family DNA polymerase [Variovorax ginsengisoli]|uniref:Protein ImuB n=1 Tax=Variovorax ginsengisoli TaxID=363844 RepID=A0ABT9SFJ1_9BURK|nr:DNA polymerase Y family protein [Variovorax ginsengisoli]MDP9902132.1 protein ImuB [Variovorax ginsengisoli]